MRLLFRQPGTVFTDKFGADETDIFRMSGVSALFGGNAAAFKRQVPERNLRAGIAGKSNPALIARNVAEVKVGKHRNAALWRNDRPGHHLPVLRNRLAQKRFRKFHHAFGKPVEVKVNHLSDFRKVHVPDVNIADITAARESALEFPCGAPSCSPQEYPKPEPSGSRPLSPTGNPSRP